MLLFNVTRSINIIFDFVYFTGRLHFLHIFYKQAYRYIYFLFELSFTFDNVIENVSFYSIRENVSNTIAGQKEALGFMPV